MPALILIPLAVLVILLPGLAWTNLLAHSRADEGSSEIGERLADAAGIGLSVIAFAGILTNFTGLQVSGTVLVVLIVLLVALLVFSWVRLKKSGPVGETPFTWEAALPLVVFAAILVFRLYQARSLDLPAWVDSIHHTLIIHLVRETGGVPESLAPYIPIPLYYHVGFHVNAALFSFIAQLEPARGLLIFGQLLNATVSLDIYRLAKSIWGDGRRGLAAMLLTGFVFQMPGYYLTWGRYTLLAGTFLLTLAMAAVMDGHHRGFDPKKILQIGLLTTGLLLTHYYAAFIWAFFLVVYSLYRLAADRRNFLRVELLLLLAGVGGGTLLALPWLASTLRFAAPFFGVEVVSPVQSIDEAYSSGYREYLWFLLGPYRSHIVHGLAIFALVVLGRRREVRPFALFVLFFGLFSLPWGVNLAPFRPDHGVILAFLPASILLADMFVRPLEADFSGPARLFAVGSVFTAMAALVIWGVMEMRSIVNPVTVLADAADVKAMGWIQENTLETSVFLINVSGWQGSTYRGVDGGWWIMPLTGRMTLLPPAIYFTGERSYVRGIQSMAARVSALKTCDEAFWEVVKEYGVTYLYLRQGVGEMRPTEFIPCEALDAVYVSGGVFIFSVAR